MSGRAAERRRPSRRRVGMKACWVAGIRLLVARFATALFEQEQTDTGGWQQTTPRVTPFQVTRNSGEAAVSASRPGPQ